MKAFVSYEIASALESVTGIETLPLKPYKRLDVPVASHPDMLINIIEENIFCYEDYYLENKDVFDKAEREGYRIITCSPPASPKYPHDIGLNALVIGKRIFGNIKYLSRELCSYATKNDYELINVKQGYTACCALVLDENNVITADTTIKNVLEQYGINVCLIREESIILKGYNKGFIGGASGKINDKICFFGNPEKLDSYREIKKSLNDLKLTEISIMSGDVYDFGGIKLI